MDNRRDVEAGTNKVADLSLNDSARGMRLSAAMLARGLMYNCQLCYDLGVTESSLSRWRSGGPMSVAMAVSLARLLGVSVDWLITGRAVSEGARCESGREQDEVTALFSAVSPDDRQLLLKLSSALLQQQDPELVRLPGSLAAATQLDCKTGFNAAV